MNGTFTFFQDHLVVMALFAFLSAVILLFVVLAPLKLYSMDKSLKYILYELKMLNRTLQRGPAEPDDVPSPGEQEEPAEILKN